MTNSQWQAIKDLLPAKTWKRKRKHSIRASINAIFYVIKGGIPWRMMPNDLPDWRLVYYYFCRWTQQGLVQQIHDKLVIKVRLQAGREPSPSLGLIDSQSVKTVKNHPAANFTCGTHQEFKQSVFTSGKIKNLAVSLHPARNRVQHQIGQLQDRCL